MNQRTKRNILLGSTMVVLLMAVATFAWGKGTPDVAAGLHNLSTTGYDPYWLGPSFYVTSSEEICIFCHTPHGGELDTPLWNKDLSTLEGAGVFTHYSNALLSSTLQGLATNRAVSTESLLCLSCHDGSIGVNVVHNISNAETAADYEISGDPNEDIGPFPVVGARIGASPTNLGGTGDLSDDHPISFSYNDVLLDPIYAGGARDGELRTVTDATTWAGEGVRFFGTDNRVECSSCHDPHVYYDYNGGAGQDYAPFLIMPNTNSQLCFACHNK